MKKINQILLDNISSQAKSCERLRKTHDFHDSSDDLIQRFLNAFEPGTYVTPHMHDNKREIFIILSGKLVFVIFDDKGMIIEYTILDPRSGSYGVEIQPKTWHTVVALESNTVCYEIKDGPYDQSTDKIFATWAPKEGDDNSKKYLDNIISKLNI